MASDKILLKAYSYEPLITGCPEGMHTVITYTHHLTIFYSPMASANNNLCYSWNQAFTLIMTWANHDLNLVLKWMCVVAQIKL